MSGHGLRNGEALACPECGASTRVLDPRGLLHYVRRRRACSRAACGHRFTTYEISATMGSRTLAASLRRLTRDAEEGRR